MPISLGGEAVEAMDWDDFVMRFRADFSLVIEV